MKTLKILLILIIAIPAYSQVNVYKDRKKGIWTDTLVRTLYPGGVCEFVTNEYDNIKKRKNLVTQPTFVGEKEQRSELFRRYYEQTMTCGMAYVNGVQTLMLQLIIQDPMAFVNYGINHPTDDVIIILKNGPALDLKPLDLGPPDGGKSAIVYTYATPLTDDYVDVLRNEPIDRIIVNTTRRMVTMPAEDPFVISDNIQCLETKL